MSMQVTINGEPEQVKAGTVKALLAARGMDRPGVAVEVNRQVVPRAEFERVELREGDVVEIVSLVGGG